MKYIVDTTATTIATPNAYGILIQVNAALTGTLTVADGSTTVAVITNPTVGSQYRYFGFTGAPKVTSNGNCDVTVSVLNHQG